MVEIDVKCDKAPIPDWGRVAIRGFLVQALVALLESLGSASWDEVTVEPDLPGGKVDVEWRLAGRAQRHMQVKSTAGAFSLHEVKGWSQELEHSSHCRVLQLALCGPVSKGVAGTPRIGEVNIVVVGDSVDTLWERAALRLMHLVGGRSASPARLIEVAKRVAATILLRSAEGHTWSPKSIWRLVGEEDLAIRLASDSPLPSHIEMRQVRSIEVEPNGDARETWLFLFRNDGDAVWRCPGELVVRVTDSDCAVVGDEQSRANHCGWHSWKEADRTVVLLYLDHQVAPGETIAFGTVIRRFDAVAVRDDRSGVFEDVNLAAPDRASESLQYTIARARNGVIVSSIGAYATFADTAIWRTNARMDRTSKVRFEFAFGSVARLNVGDRGGALRNATQAALETGDGTEVWTRLRDLAGE